MYDGGFVFIAKGVPGELLKNHMPGTGKMVEFVLLNR